MWRDEVKGIEVIQKGTKAYGVNEDTIEGRRMTLGFHPGKQRTYHRRYPIDWFCA